MMEEVVELRREANRAFVGRDYERAKELFGQVIVTAPDSPEGYLGLARVLERVGDHRGVVSLLEPVVGRVRAVGLSRALGDAYRVLAYRGDRAAVEKAIRYYEHYHEERRDPVTLFYLGELYREMKKDYAAALRCLRESWDLDPGSKDVWNAAMDCANRLGSTDEAVVLQRLWQEHSARKR